MRIYQALHLDLLKMQTHNFSKNERESYLSKLKGHYSLFIIYYENIVGVLTIEHHIELKKESKPIA